jgi:hypothetical protein
MRRKRFTVLSRICPVSLKRMWWAISASICPIWSLEKPQPREDAVRQPDAFLHMPVEADAVGHPEGRRLADVVQQRAEGQRHPGVAWLAADRAAVQFFGARLKDKVKTPS